MAPEAENIPKLFTKIDSRKYDLSCCFLCGKEVDTSDASSEHVIPLWLQKRYKLMDQELILLNGTSIAYRYLKIPCCIECNTSYLSPIETEVQKRLEAGYQSFKEINREILFFWLGKIYYGLIYRELSLLMNRADPERGYITTPEFMEQFKAHYMFLQGIRGEHKFVDFFPASIFIFNTQCPAEIKNAWDFTDNSRSMLISMRMGEVGIVAVLQDGGALESIGEMLNDFLNTKLHPIQFKEAVAVITYKSLLFNRTPKYISFEEDGIVKTHQLPLQGMSSKPIFDDWDQGIYAQVLSEITKIPVEALSPTPGKVMSWIKNSKGDINLMSIS